MRWPTQQHKKETDSSRLVSQKKLLEKEIKIPGHRKKQMWETEFFGAWQIGVDNAKREERPEILIYNSR